MMVRVAYILRYFVFQDTFKPTPYLQVIRSTESVQKFSFLHIAVSCSFDRKRLQKVMIDFAKMSRRKGVHPT